MTDYKGMLDRAVFALQDQMGKFMSSGQALLDIKDRAAAYHKAPNGLVASRAQAITSKANGLLENFKSIQKDGLGALGQASELKDKMNSDPTWRAILSAEWKNFGWETLQRAESMVSSVALTVKNLGAVGLRITDHLKAVGSLKTDLGDLDNLAQGKGIKAAATSIFSSIGTAALGKPLTIVSVGLAAYLFLPPMLSSLARQRWRA